MNNVLFLMCLMGSTVYVCYLVLCRIFQYRMKPGQRLFLLLTAMFFYLLPVPVFAERLFRRFTDYPELVALIPEALKPRAKIYEISEMRLITPDGVIHRSVYEKVFLAFLAVWGLFLLVHMLLHLVKYFRMRGNLNGLKNLAEDSDRQRLDELRNKLGIRRKAQLRIFRECTSPFVFGVLHPVIVLPARQEKENWENIAAHELYHIKRCDNLLKWLAFLVFAVHWYCPLSLFFFGSMENVLELLCDQRVLKYASEKEKDGYVELLLELPIPEKDCAGQSVFYSAYKSRNFKITRERILMIKHANLKGSVLAVVFLAVSVVVGAAPVLAYKPVKNNEVSFEEYERFEAGNMEAEGVWVNPGERLPKMFEEIQKETIDAKYYFDIADEYFVSDTGEIYFDISKTETRAVCVHSYQSGEYHLHEADNAGGCYVSNYSAKYCTKCGKVINAVLLSKTYYPVCTHK